MKLTWTELLNILRLTDLYLESSALRFSQDCIRLRVNMQSLTKVIDEICDLL